MNPKNTLLHTQVIKYFKKGLKLVEIGEKFDLTKQRISQILKDNNIEPRITQQKLIKELVKNINIDVKKGLLMDEILSKYNITTKYFYLLQSRYGVKYTDVKRIKRSIIDKNIFNLYKKGLTGKEILQIYPSFRSIDYVYKIICNQNNGHLPKRLSNRNKKVKNLQTIVGKLSKTKKYTEIVDVLSNNNYTNTVGKTPSLSNVNYYINK